MTKRTADDSLSLRGILDAASRDNRGVEASTATDGDRPYDSVETADGRRSVDARELPKEVIVAHRQPESVDGPEDYLDYVFEVTGELEKLEPNEDSGVASDEVRNSGDRVRVEGTVGYGDDRFAFSGKLIKVHAPPKVELTVKRRNDRKKDGEKSAKRDGGSSGERKTGTGGWRDGYRRYVSDYVPEFYESVPKKHNLYRCVKYVADRTNFWETLGEKMYLDRAVVTAAYAYPLPNYDKVDQETWDGILGEMYADMPEKYRKKKGYPVTVPVFVVYLYDGYYNAVAYLRPYGNHKSYGYVIKNGYQQQTRYDSKADYESNTWWFTEDGWGDAGVTDGGILDGVPIGLIE